MIYKTEVIENFNLAHDACSSERYSFTKVKITPNKLAKEIVWNVLDSAGYWEENGTYNHEDMTEREKEQVRDMVQKQVDRVSKFLLK